MNLKASVWLVAAVSYQVVYATASATDIPVVVDMDRKTKAAIACESGYDKSPGVGRRAGMISCDQLDYGTFEVKLKSAETIICSRKKFSVFDTGIIQQCYVAKPVFVTLHDRRQRCGKSVVFRESGDVSLCWN